jgi:ABC-2 type transport system permease protein
MLLELLRKEFLQIARNRFLPKIILVMPCMALLVFPWAANHEIRGIRVAIVDHDRGALSQRLAAKIGSSGYFETVASPTSAKTAFRLVDAGEVDAILEIPAGFGRSAGRAEPTLAMGVFDAVNGTKGGLANAYLASIVTDFVRESGVRATAPAASPGISTAPQMRFNPGMRYRSMMVPALMVMILTMICGFLPALNIVSEKEAGTIEQMNVTPVPKAVFVLAKLVPYWIIGLVVISIGLLIARTVYGLAPLGGVGTVYLLTAVYILVVSGLGIVISNHSDTMQQAMFVMFFFVMVFNLMSGLFTPVASMPGWAQATTWINPLAYYIDAIRRIFLKGSGIADLAIPFLALGGLAVFFNGWAVLSYRKTR